MLPKNLNYKGKVESAPAKSTRVNIAPQNGTGPYNLGDTIILNIPTRRNIVLVPSESPFKFSLAITNNSGAANYLRWDSCGAHGIIQRIRIFHGSNLLQDIDNYGMLTKMLYDLQVNTSSTTGKYNILAGTRSDIMSQPPAAVAAADSTHCNGVTIGVATAATTGELASILNSVLSQPCASINSGDYLGGPANAGTTTTVTYSLNLVSLIGSLCQNQYLPLFAMSSAPLRVEIQLVDSINKAMVCTSSASTTIAVSNVEYIANFIELSDVAMSMIQESLSGQPLQFVLSDWRNYQYNYALPDSTTTQMTMPIPAKFSSLKSIFITQRDRYNKDLYAPFSSNTCSLQGSGNPFVAGNYYFRVGPNIVPAKAPSTTAEYFTEVLKAIGNMCDMYHSPSIDKNSYSQSKAVLEAAIANNTLYPHTISQGINHSGSFYVGLDLENYTNAPKDQIYAGYNSNTDDIFYIPTFVVANHGLDSGVATVTVRFDAFALFDTLLVFENETAYARF